MRKETAPASATMPVQRAKTRLRTVKTPAAIRKAANPIAAIRKGPAAPAVTARLTTGFALAPSELAAAIVTRAMDIPAIPVRAPANATLSPVRPVLVRRGVVRRNAAACEPTDDEE